MSALITRFISTSLKSMSPYNPAFQHAEAVRRLLYDPEFSKSSSYNANQNIVPNAEAMGTVSSKYRPFRSNNSYAGAFYTWIVEIGVLAELEKYVGILFTGLENTGAWKYLEDGQDPATQQGQAGGTSYDHSQHAAAYEDMITPEAVILSMHVSRSHGYEDTTLLEEHLARSPPPQSTSQSVPSKGNTEQIVQLERLSRLCAALKEAAQATLRSLESAPSAGFASMLVSAMWKRAAPINYTAAAASAIVGIGGQVQEWAPQPYVKGVTGILSGLLALTSVLVPDKRGDPDGRLAVLSATSVAIAGLENDMYRLLIAYLELYESVTKILMTHSPGARPLTREDKKRLKQFFEAFKRHVCQHQFCREVPAARISLHTRELDISPGELLEVTETAWDAVKEMVNRCEVMIDTAATAPAHETTLTSSGITWTPRPSVPLPPPVLSYELFWSLVHDGSDMPLQLQRAMAARLYAHRSLAVLVYTNWAVVDNDVRVRKLMFQCTGRFDVQVVTIDDYATFHKKSKTDHFLAYVVLKSDAERAALLASSVWTAGALLIMLRSPTHSRTGLYRFFRVYPGQTSSEASTKRDIQEALDLDGTRLQASETVVRTYKRNEDQKCGTYDVMVCLQPDATVDHIAPELAQAYKMRFEPLKIKGRTLVLYPPRRGARVAGLYPSEVLGSFTARTRSMAAIDAEIW
ncbi:hypothetical protein HDZ31DRAFT_75348 [Schizophyllum fasciatum]